jgi:hypothetical protein
LRELWE